MLTKKKKFKKILHGLVDGASSLQVDILDTNCLEII